MSGDIEDCPPQAVSSQVTAGEMRLAILRFGGRRSLRQILWALCAGTAALLAGPAQAQWAASCPPPLKDAAGACVASCPAGYEDRGRTCTFRSYSH